MGQLASRICGISDLYGESGKGPGCSLNFVTCHDGFALIRDLVSYARKHNEANGEDNRGPQENYSANYGVEGESDDPAIELVRRRQTKNFLLTLAISRGVPMLLGGDEFGRSQRGNDNAYCKDNETSWVDWSLLRRNNDVFQFARSMLARRRAHPVLRRAAFYREDDIRWFNPSGVSPTWSDPFEKCLACRVSGNGGPDLYLMFNAHADAVAFALPPHFSPAAWHLAADTARIPPAEVSLPGSEPFIEQQSSYVVEGRSAVILVELQAR